MIKKEEKKLNKMTKVQKQIRNKELVDQAAERLAEIFIMQLEHNKKSKISN